MKGIDRLSTLSDSAIAQAFREHAATCRTPATNWIEERARELTPNPPPQPSASVAEMARELLAREYADDPVLAEKVRAGTSRNGDVPRALRAIECALTTAAGGGD